MEKRGLGILYIAIAFFATLEFYRYQTDYDKFNITAFVVAVVFAIWGIYTIFKKDDNEE